MEQWLSTRIDTAMEGDDGFQTAEAIGIAAVGLIIAVAILGLLQVLGADVIGWFRGQIGI